MRGSDVKNLLLFFHPIWSGYEPLKTSDFTCCLEICSQVSRNCTLPAHVPGGSCRGQSKTSILPGQSRKGNWSWSGQVMERTPGQGCRQGGRGSRRKDLGRQHRQKKPEVSDILKWGLILKTSIFILIMYICNNKQHRILYMCVYLSIVLREPFQYFSDRVAFGWAKVNFLHGMGYVRV